MNKFLNSVNKNEILKYLNYRSGGISPEVYELIERATNLLIERARPRFLYELFDAGDQRIQAILVGRDINTMLLGSHTIALMLASLGQEVDTLIRRYSYSDLAFSLVLDATASASVETLRAYLCDHIMANFEGQYATDSFSPGYGDMPLRVQGDFLKLLNADKRLGIKITEEGMMIPRKSISAVMGISKFKQVHRHRGCESCQLFLDCHFRKGGKTCGYDR